jgi:hypothetical protein
VSLSGRRDDFGAGGNWTQINKVTVGSTIIPTAAHKQKRYKEYHVSLERHTTAAVALTDTGKVQGLPASRIYVM